MEAVCRVQPRVPLTGVWMEKNKNSPIPRLCSRFIRQNNDSRLLPTLYTYTFLRKSKQPPHAIMSDHSCSCGSSCQCGTSCTCGVRHSTSPMSAVVAHCLAAGYLPALHFFTCRFSRRLANTSSQPSSFKAANKSNKLTPEPTEINKQNPTYHVLLPRSRRLNNNDNKYHTSTSIPDCNIFTLDGWDADADAGENCLISYPPT